MRTVIPLVLVAFLCTSSVSEARSVKWFTKGVSVEISGQVDVPLYRGDHAQHRPLVRVEAKGEKKSRVDLAVVDVAHGWTKIGWRMVRSLGLVPEETEIFGRYAQVVVIPELVIGDLILRDVPAEVLGSDTFVIGFGAVSSLATAVLPSVGVVRFSTDGKALVESVGTPVPMHRQTAGRWKVGDRKVYGTGLSFSVEGAMSGRDGWLELRTDSPTSLVTAAYEDPNQRRSGGEIHIRGRGRIGEIELAESWAIRDESLVGDQEEFVGALAYDQLYSVDIAVSPGDGLAAIKATYKPKWERAEEVRLELAMAAHRAAGIPSGDEHVDTPPKIGFGTTDANENPAGEKGDSTVLRLEQNLATALWEVGKLTEAIPHQLRAAEAAGDRCGPRMKLGLKRLQWSGSLQKQSFIVELIRQPLREAGELWDRWEVQTPKVREAVRNGKSVPAGTFEIEQDASCLTSWGTLMAAYVAQGNTEASSTIYKNHYGKDPLVAYAQGLSLLQQNQAATAEIPIREALSFAVRERGDVKLGLGRALVDQKRVEPVNKLVAEVPGLDLNHGLVAAMIVLEWGELLDGEKGPAGMASRLVTADRYWIPGQLVAAWKKVDEADPDQLKAELIRQNGRDAGSTKVQIYRAVLTAIQGEGTEARKMLRTVQKSRPPTPDLFAALALVASLNGRDDRVRANLLELHLRYPTLSFDTLGLPLSVDEAPEPG